MKMEIRRVREHCAEGSSGREKVKGHSSVPPTSLWPFDDKVYCHKTGPWNESSSLAKVLVYIILKFLKETSIKSR